MAMLRKFIAIFAISFIGIAGTSNADILDEIPAEIRDYVSDPDFMDPMQPLGESDYSNCKRDRPLQWTIEYANSYAGKPWRKGVMQSLYGDYLPMMKDAGIYNDIVDNHANPQAAHKA